MLVVYRACPVSSPLKNRPNKGELVRKCFLSLIEAFKDVDYKLFVLIDKPTMEFRDIFKEFDVEESYYSNFSEGNTLSFHRQIDLALEYKDDRFLFVEDDYYFLPNAGSVLSKTTLPFYSPYDHPGYYTEDIHKESKHEVLIDANWHWQTNMSTTLTFGGELRYLEQVASTMKKYGWADHHMWCDVTRSVPLYTPIPSLATHVENDVLAPTIDWSILQTS